MELACPTILDMDYTDDAYSNTATLESLESVMGQHISFLVRCPAREDERLFCAGLTPGINSGLFTAAVSCTFPGLGPKGISIPTQNRT